jgi:protocatechuate 3,4-dioxygenase beta subunit
LTLREDGEAGQVGEVGDLLLCINDYLEVRMLTDDTPLGYVLTRREAVVLLGATGVMLLTPGALVPGRFRRVACVARPEQTEGPYFVDDMLNRADIRSDPTDGAVKPGSPLELTFSVSRLAGAACAPLAGALVDLWQCDHLGVYSDVVDPRFSTKGRKFLRGYQVTDGAGLARFITIFPGWYQGRTVHLHFKIRSAPDASPGFAFTSQIYFDDAFTDRVHALEPYAARGQGRTRNDRDRIYARGGPQLTVTPTARAAGEGHAATFEIALALG